MSPIVPLESVQQFAAINLTRDPGAIGGPKIIPNCAEITLNWSLSGGKVSHNVLHGAYTGSFAGSAAQCNGIMTGLTSGAQWTALAGFFPTTTVFTGVSMRDLNSANQPLISSTNASVPGTSGVADLPNEVAAVITTRTAFTGPQHRGRIYLAGFATNCLAAGNTMSAPLVTALNNWASIIAGVFTANGSYQFCIGHVHRQAYTGRKGTQHPDRPFGTVPIQTIGVRDNHWDTNRRRGLK